MIHEDLLRDEVDPARRLEPIGIELPVRPAELHQIDARQVARRVVEEHVLAAVVNDDAIGDEMACRRLRQVVHVFFAAGREQRHAIYKRIGIRGHLPIQFGKSLRLVALGHKANLFLETPTRRPRNSQRVDLLHGVLGHTT